MDKHEIAVWFRTIELYIRTGAGKELAFEALKRLRVTMSDLMIAEEIKQKQLEVTRTYTARSFD